MSVLCKIKSQLVRCLIWLETPDFLGASEKAGAGRSLALSARPLLKYTGYSLKIPLDKDGTF